MKKKEEMMESDKWLQRVGFFTVLFVSTIIVGMFARIGWEVTGLFEKLLAIEK